MLEVRRWSSASVLRLWWFNGHHYLYMCRVRLMAGFRMTGATLDVLEVLLDSDGDLYGLKIALETGRPTGSVFPILARMEDHGWAVSEWENPHPASRGPRRRLYRLTPDGAVRAQEALAERRGRRTASFGVVSPKFRPSTGEA